MSARRSGVKRTTAYEPGSPESLAYRATGAALSPYDRRMVELERVWGSVDRLLSLVSVDTARKFGSAMAKMQDAISEVASDFDPVEVDRRVSVVLRGMDALVSEAIANGHQPFDRSKLWVVPGPDVVHVIGLDMNAATMAAKHLGQFSDPDHPERKVRVWGIEELLRIAALFNPVTERVQDLFPGAVPVRVEPAGVMEPRAKPPPAPADGDPLDDVLPLTSELPGDETSEFD